MPRKCAKGEKEIASKGFGSVATQVKGVIFDLDGVITGTAKVHALAWAAMFNEYLQKRAEDTDSPFLPFDRRDDYFNYVDGKPRFEGVKSFLMSRGIQLPYGDVDDPPDAETVCGLGNRKNEQFQVILKREGPDVFQSSVELVKSLKRNGIRTAVASSSRNCKLILELGGLSDLFELIVDGVLSHDLKLKGKPDPDVFIWTAREMGLLPGECVVVEDAISGVQAGRSGNFGLTLGVARNVKGQLLKRFGADIVVLDLAEISVGDIEDWFVQGVERDGWNLSYDGFDPGDEKLRETLFTVGNGYLGTRGCFEGEDASFSFYPGTYIAGVFNKIGSQVQDREILNNDFVNCPNWLPVKYRIGAGRFESPLSQEILSYNHRLDMRAGVMERTIVCRDGFGRITRICSRRLASMANHHLLALKYELTPLNYSDSITFRSELDGNVINDNVPRYRQLTSKHLEPVGAAQEGDGSYLHVKTNRSGYHIHMRSKFLLYENGKRLELEQTPVSDQARIGRETVVQARENHTYALEKFVTVFTSLDQETVDPAGAGKSLLGRVKTFQGVYGPHARAWKDLWDRADLRITGDRFVQKVIRMHFFHLMVTASPHNKRIDAGMPARGLHGEAYRGHIFWDELYIMNFFDLNCPEITRALLKYRYKRLDAAREYARENGYKGAMYPWQTADSGGEETQELHYNPESEEWGPDLSRRQRHVSIAIFYNVWRYVASSGDRCFLERYGAEMMLEIARFWASIAEFDPADQKYHIEGVMGPDEFHEKLPENDKPGLKDNAYTNVMVVWLMERTLELLESLKPSVLNKLKDKIGLREEEADKWRDMTARLNVIMSEDGVIAQFDGYFGLKELDWDSYRKRYYSIHRMDRILKAEGDSPDKYKVAKQADVLMMFYVLSPEEVCRILRQLGHEVGEPLELLRRNFEYYEKRTSHGSTLSKVVHAVVSSFIHVDEKPWSWFMEAMISDIFDTQGGTTTEGVHTGVMAGTFDAIVKCFARVDLSGETPSINPRLPEHWDNLTFRLSHRKIWYYFELNHSTVRVMLDKGAPGPVPIRVYGQEASLEPGATRMFVVPGREDGQAYRAPCKLGLPSVNVHFWP